MALERRTLDLKSIMVRAYEGGPVWAALAVMVHEAPCRDLRVVKVTRQA